MTRHAKQKPTHFPRGKVRSPLMDVFTFKESPPNIMQPNSFYIHSTCGTQHLPLQHQLLEASETPTVSKFPIFLGDVEQHPPPKKRGHDMCSKAYSKLHHISLHHSVVGGFNSFEKCYCSQTRSFPQVRLKKKQMICQTTSQ